MKFRDFLANWGLSNLKISLGFLDMEFAPQDADRQAAWDMYIELLTRVTTQRLPENHGDEETALTSVFNLFDLTRGILRTHGPGCARFARLAIPILNQVIRPFTAKWHRLKLEGALASPAHRSDFRTELADLQVILRHYTQALAQLAGVEDLTQLESNSQAGSSLSSGSPK